MFRWDLLTGASALTHNELIELYQGITGNLVLNLRIQELVAPMHPYFKEKLIEKLEVAVDNIKHQLMINGIPPINVAESNAVQDPEMSPGGELINVKPEYLDQSTF